MFHSDPLPAMLLPLFLSYIATLLSTLFSSPPLRRAFAFAVAIIITDIAMLLDVAILRHAICYIVCHAGLPYVYAMLPCCLLLLLLMPITLCCHYIFLLLLMPLLICAIIRDATFFITMPPFFAAVAAMLDAAAICRC